MNRDDIIRMAREAGFMIDEVSQQYQPNCIFHTNYMVDELLERFAALVAAAEREAMLRDGWRRCAVGQGTTQFCAMTEGAVKAEREEIERLKRENAILRKELKRSMVSGMPDDEAEEAAEQYIIHLILHNEGAE